VGDLERGSMLLGFKVGFRGGQGKVLTGIKDKKKKGKQKGHLGGNPSVRPSMQTEAAAFKGALGGQVKCPAKGFSPAACGRPRG